MKCKVQKPYKPFFLLHRGDKFRCEFARLGEVRSLIPQTVKIMALTTTATLCTRKEIYKRLSMKTPTLVYRPPAKGNIAYAVYSKPSIESIVTPICNKLLEEGPNCAKILIYCRKYDEVSTMYSLFRQQLGAHFTNPVGAINLVKYRLVDMFSKCTETQVKNETVTRFVDPSSNLRVVIATVAFGMGLDCPCVRQIIHWGPSQDTDMYVQEIGRAGRDDLLAMVSLFWRPSDQMNTAKAMMDYCRNTDVCRRQALFQDFEDRDLMATPPTKCQCCDTCAQNCTCGQCSFILSNFIKFPL